MLVNERRLKKAGDFQFVYKSGKIYKGRYMVVRIVNRDDLKKSRIGLAPARKTKNAVDKNKIKRRISEICRLHQEQVIDHHDMVINIYQNASEANYKRLEFDLLAVLKRAGLLQLNQGNER